MHAFGKAPISSHQGTTPWPIRPPSPLTASRLARLGALCAAPTLLLTGCFSEPKERKAFIEFLDKEVLSARGMSYPVPNEGKRQTFGDYAKHYDVVVQFIEKMEALPLPNRSRTWA